MRDEAEKRIGHLYPKIEITEEMAKERPDLKALVGQKLTVIAWIWARTVRSPNPAFAGVEVPLASTFMLSTKPGKEAYVEPVVAGQGYRFMVRVGPPPNAEVARNGTKLARGANFRCVMSGTPMSGDHIKAEGMGGRMSARLMAIVAEGHRGRIYLQPTEEQENAAKLATPHWTPDGTLVEDARAFTPTLYGITKWGDLFTPRQLAMLATFADLVGDAQRRVEQDARSAGIAESAAALYGEAVTLYLGLTLSKMADAQSSFVHWKAERDRVITTFSRNALPMVWDFAESNAFAGGSGCYDLTCHNMTRVLDTVPAGEVQGAAFQCAAQDVGSEHANVVYSCDPPYYDNIGYGDLSDFFYIWLRRAMRRVFASLVATVAVPKAEELVAIPYRHGSRERAEAFFLDGMTSAMRRLAERAHPGIPVTIYYAFRQSETDKTDGVTNTGWETFLEAVLRAGFAVSGTWPIRTEREAKHSHVGI